MKKLSKNIIFITVIVFSLIFLSFVGCKSTATEQTTAETTTQLKKEIVFGNSQFWGTIAFARTINDGLVDAAKEWEKKTGSTIKIVKTDAGVTDPSLQVRDLEDLAVQKVDGVFVFAGDVATCDEAIGRLFNTENIPVVITDIGVGKSDYVSFIITDNYLGGQMAAEAMAESVPKGSKVVAFQIAPNNLSTRNRSDGFMDKAKELGYNVLPEKVVVNTAEGGKLVMEDTMTAEPDIAAVFGTANDCAIGVANSLKTAGKVGKIKLLCFDINDIILQFVKEGTIEAVIVQDPYYMGHEGMNQMMYWLTGQKDLIVKDIKKPPTICTLKNASDYDNNPAVITK